MKRIALIGFGEVGQRCARDLNAMKSWDVIAWDLLFIDAESLPARAAVNASVRIATSLADALAGATTVISAVTATEAVEVATAAGPLLAPGTWFIDVNSISPAHRVEAAGGAEICGGRYIEAAVMSPIEPFGTASPILLGGPHAKSFNPKALGFTNAQVYAEKLGLASAAKLCRSVIVKGLEALMTESLCAARHYGVETTVLQSLRTLFAESDTPALAKYLISRSRQHGIRRAAEMLEAASTVHDAGITPWLAEATVHRQEWAGRRPTPFTEYAQLAELIDATRAETPC